MNMVKRFLLWCVLINKRLFCRPSFWVMICLVPILTFGMSVVGQKKSGMISIALSAENMADETVIEVIDKLTENDPLIKYSVHDTPQEARNAVAHANTDAAWIFPEKLDERLKNFALDPDEDNAAVTVVQREDTVVLKLANERLCATLYSYCAEEFYIGYVRDNLPELDALSEDKLTSYYDEVWAEGEVFEYSYIDEKAAPGDNVNYLTAPIRGLLAVLCVMSGLAAAMFYQKDRENGLVARIPRSERFAFEFVCHAVPIADTALVVFLSLMISGLGVSPLRELAATAVYILACSAMCMFIGRLFTKIDRLAVFAPLLVIVLIIVCPVFIDFVPLRPLQLIFAPSYYINAAHSLKYIGFTAVYAAVISAVNWVLGQKRR